MTELDIESWNRKNHFHNFLHFTQPFFNITANVDVSKVKEHSKNLGLSFFLTYYYLALKAINEVKAFRYRIREDKVIVHDVVHGSCAVLNDDETFSYAYYDYHADFSNYYNGASKALADLKENPVLDPQFHRDDLVHASVIPWVSFTSFEHAKRLGAGDSTPKLVFGKLTEEGNRLLMPIAVAVHHALADGIDIGKFFMKYEEFADRIEEVINV